MLVKKKNKPAPIIPGTNLEEIEEVKSVDSLYQTIEDYVNGEEILLDEEHEKDIKVVQEIEESPRDDEEEVDTSPKVKELDMDDITDEGIRQDRVVMISDCDVDSQDNYQTQ